MMDTTIVKLSYTIYLEPATNDWAWVKNAADETMYVGSCVTDGKKWFGHAPVSELLIEMVGSWFELIRPYVEGHVSDSDYDWATFNTQGIAIAKQLKLEFGDNVDVRYVKPVEDPSSKHDEGFSILNDGSMVPIFRKPNIKLI